jgi:outer membrane lipoprotein-sorting protein
MTPRIPRLTALLAVAALLLFAMTPARAELSDTDRAAVQQVEEYLNGVRSLSADFVQIGPSGEVARGKVFLRRPGKLRFEYAPPSPLLLVADGRWLVLEDRELKHVDRWPVGETPLAVLVADRVDLNGSVEATQVKREGGVLRVTLVDRKRRGEGHLTLIFNETPLELRQWEVHDAQGGVTHVSLHDPQVNLQLADRLFFYDHFGKFPGDRGR